MQSNDQTRELLSRLALSELGEAEMGLLTQIAQKRRYEPRKVVVRQGTSIRLYAVLRGH